MIAELYQGEVLGEALFNGMLRDVDDARERHVISSLLQYESETKVYLRQAAAARGLSVMEDEGHRAAGHETAAFLGSMTWRDKMRRLRTGIANHYLPRYRLLESEARPDDRIVTSFMVRHEGALLEVVSREEAGQVETSLDALAPYLRFPLPREGSHRP